MPPVRKIVSTRELPESLKPYGFFRLDVSHFSNHDKNVSTDCVFCNKEGKFVISVETGQYKCWSCLAKGNATTFINQLWEMGTEEVEELAEERQIPAETLIEWGVRYCALSRSFIIPGFDPTSGKLQNLSRWMKNDQGKHRWFSTPGLNQKLYGINFDLKKNVETIYVVEGSWNSMVWLDGLRSSKQKGYAVVGVPGCNVFHEAWASWFMNRDVVFIYDSDRPRRNPQTGDVIEPAGLAGVKRASRIVVPHARSVKYVEWGKDGYDPALKDGHDVRDHYQIHSSEEATADLLDRVRDIPESWNISGKGSKEKLALSPCTDWTTLTRQWRKAMKWTDGLEYGLACMLATVTSTQSLGDQLWMRIVAPASSGKTTLAMGIAAAHEYAKIVDTIRGFTSGFMNDDGETFDLASDIDGKTMITLDGDTLLQSPNLPNILAEGRRLYDGGLSSHFKNGAGKGIQGHRFTWLLCGTNSLRSLDQSELGERFMDCVMMREIDDELEDEILLRVANRSEQAVGMLSGDKADEQQPPEMTLAIQMTGGYVKYLRDNSIALLNSVEMSDDMKRLCTRLGKFVAILRARPSSRQHETAEREFAARLTSQFVRLCKCLAVILNRESVDDKVLQMARRVAMDTARGQTLQIVSALYKYQDGLDYGGVSVATGIIDGTSRKLLRFLRMIGALEYRATVGKKGTSVVNQKARWFLSATTKKLYEQVVVTLED